VQFITGGIADSPLTIGVYIPRSNGELETLLASATVQLLDDAGRPAEYGGHADDLASLKPRVDLGRWEYETSVPSKPGTYHARVEWRVLPDSEQGPTPVTQTLELMEPQLQVRADSGPPLTSGYVFARDSNLWILSTDAKRERRLTFFDPYYEYADNPAWSQDGKSIAFAYSQKAAQNEIPATSIWAVDPDGGNLRQIAAHGPDESLYNPAWSPDGKYIYMTVEKTDVLSGTDIMGAPLGQKQVDRLDLTTGAREQWLPSAEMPGTGGPGNDVLSLEEAPQAGSGELPPTQRLVRVSADGSSKSVLVNDNTYQLMYAPSMSPDGKWVVFAAINPPAPQASQFDFFRWLSLEPETASAHGQPWDLYLVPSTGGTATRITSLNEDQPHPVWLDNSTIALMGTTGLYKFAIGNDGKPISAPVKIHNGAPHAGLTWHAP
jgi:hypothetical protein